MEKNFYIMSDPDDFFMTAFNEETGETYKEVFKIGADGIPEQLIR